MAQRRMFSPDIVNSDAFIEMPPSTQALYFQLGMKADDDGFVNPKMVMRMIGSSDDELKVLLSKRFVLPFENGVLVIKHWKVNNLVRKDWYKPTVYLEQKKLLFVKENGSYTFDDNQGKQLVNEPLTQVRLGKVRLENTKMPPEDDILENIQEEKRGIQHDYQFIGLEVFEKTGAPKEKKAECIRLAKTYPNLINRALSFSLDYPNPALKWKMFLWKLNQLRNEKTITNN